MEILKGFFADLQSKPISLNYSGTKSIQVCLDLASFPNHKPAYKLNDNDHHCSITFSKETMEAIIDKSGQIRRSMSIKEETTFFINSEMKVFTERMHNQCAVSFLSIQGVRMNMMDNTFSKLTGLSRKLALLHMKLKQKVNGSAINLKQLFDFILAKYNQCNSNGTDFKVFLQQLHQGANSLCGEGALTNPSTQNLNTSDTSNDNEDEDKDEYDEDEDMYDDYDEDEDMYDDNNRRRRRRGYRYDDYDDDDDEEERFIGII